jgi:drug/metabolite transporter (DMT)-like permease
MDEERIFALVASLCLLLWLLARERRIPPNLRQLMLAAAYLGVAGGLLYAVVASVLYFAGSS